MDSGDKWIMGTVDDGQWGQMDDGDRGRWTMGTVDYGDDFRKGDHMMRDYKKIVAWQRSHALTLAVYEFTKRFPDEERFGLTSQVRRAAYSVPSNNAEGSGRDSQKDYLRFLFISLASLKETEYFLLLAHDLGYLNDDAYETLSDQVNSSFRVLHGLIKATKKEVGAMGRFTARMLAFFTIAGTYGVPQA